MPTDSKRALTLTESEIRRIVRESVTELLDEMAYPASFSMEEFKRIKSFKGRLEYCAARLPKLGRGSSRAVFKIDDEKCLKLAVNRKGLAQNEVEAEPDYILEQIGLVARIYDYDENFLWVEMQLARRATKNDFKRLTPYDFETMCEFITYNYGRYSNRHVRVEPEYKKLFDSPDFYDTMYDTVFYAMYDYLGNYQPKIVGDLQKLSSWGVVKQGGQEQLVLIDFGLNEDVYNKYYLKTN